MDLSSVGKLINPEEWLIHIVGAIAVGLGGFFYGCHVTADHFEAKANKAIVAAEVKVRAAEAKGAASASENARDTWNRNEHVNSAFVGALRDADSFRVRVNACPALSPASGAASGVPGADAGQSDRRDGTREFDLSETARSVVTLGHDLDVVRSELRSCQADLHNDRQVTSGN